MSRLHLKRKCGERITFRHTDGALIGSVLVSETGRKNVRMSIEMPESIRVFRAESDPFDPPAAMAGPDTVVPA